MTSKERWLAVLERKSVDRVPCDIWATPEIEKKFGRRNMLIQWEPKTWTLLRKKISMLIGRQFLIRQDWFLEMRDEFTIKGII